MRRLLPRVFFFFFNDTATTEIYTLSLHDALPIYPPPGSEAWRGHAQRTPDRSPRHDGRVAQAALDRPAVYGRRRSEEHTSELQSQSNLVCRLLLEKKKSIRTYDATCPSP